MFIINSVILHGIRVGILSLKLSRKLELSKKMSLNIFIGAIFHDIGKFKISKDILNKPSRLTNKEFEIIKTHTNLKLKFIKNQVVKNIILYHHENVDGTGYKNLTVIPYESKIIRICDVFDALTHDRVYHKKISKQEAINAMFKQINCFDCDIFIKFIKVIFKNNKSYSPTYNPYHKIFNNTK